MKRIFSTVSFKDFIFIYTGIFLNRVLGKFRFHSYYSPLYNLIRHYDQKDYNLRKNGKSLQVSGKDEYEGLEFLLRPGTSDSLVFEQVIVEKEYLPLIDIINKNAATKIETIIDAGANVGFATIFLKKYFSKAKVVCVEADPDNSKQLSKNVSLNRFDNDVHVLNVALWTSDNESLIIKRDFRDGDSWSIRVAPHSSNQNSNDTKIKCVTLQSIAKEYSLPLIDILKMDIEGAEAELFKNSEFINFLSERVRFCAIEFHEEVCSKSSLEAILNKNHFEIITDKETHFCINTRLKK